MVKILEQLLFEKTKDSQSSILYAQWQYDKQVIPVALQSISNLFPHYSLHDESHSITIINNIIRIIGLENLEKLTAIDIWLLLESSYCHDVGMIVSGDEVLETIKTSEFIEFFKSIKSDNTNGLWEFASLFEIKEDKIHYSSSALDIRMHDGIKFILAEYFRRVHAERSKTILNNPLEALSLTTPRGVIPQRLFKVLGDICSSHTKNFNNVMQLPFSEVGIDVEDAHPRFIASMLRLGDLLDLDNNRFSEVMLRTLTKIPIDSLIHKTKHLSINAFRLDKEMIEVVANCNDYETANVTQHWFNYLNSEIQNQMLCWNDIVPTKEFGILPTIGKLNVNLENYEYLDGKSKPKFTVEPDKALELLRGAGIYKDAHQSIREILQNAVDATLIRFWIENKSNINIDNPKAAENIEFYNKYPIKIEIIGHNVIDDIKKWEIKITDNGVGLTKNDLKYLSQTGSSVKNKKKNKTIEDMPIWLKPSGFFGIGFQSVFLLTERVTIKSKNIFDQQLLHVELNSPHSQRNGDILLKKTNTDFNTPIGTEIEFIHATEAIPKIYSVKGDSPNAVDYLNNYDLFRDDSMDIVFGQILDEIIRFGQHCPFPVVLESDEMNILFNDETKAKFDFYDYETALELNITANESWNGVKTYYKNQDVQSNLSINFLTIEANIHQDVASDVLTLSRNEIKTEYYRKLRTDIIDACARIIDANYDDIFTTDFGKQSASMFMNYYSHKFNFKIDFDKYDEWKKIEVKVNGQNYQIDKLLEECNELHIVAADRNVGFMDYKFEKNDSILEIHLAKHSSSDFIRFLEWKYDYYFNGIEKTKLEDNSEKIILTKCENLTPSNIDTIKKFYNNMARLFYRAILPCLKEYSKLRIKNDVPMPYLFTGFMNNFNVSYPKMVSPYLSQYSSLNEKKIEFSVNDKLIDWVFENRFDSKTTKNEIAAAYDQFNADLDLETK